MIETIRTIAEPVLALLIVFGALLSAISAFGLVRLPDVYMRSHAATKSATLGVLSILLGAFLYFAIYKELTSFRVLLAVVFVFVTAPVAGHLIGRAAYRSGVPLWEKSVSDELSEVVKRERRMEQGE